MDVHQIKKKEARYRVVVMQLAFHQEDKNKISLLSWLRLFLFLFFSNVRMCKNLVCFFFHFKLHNLALVGSLITEEISMKKRPYLTMYIYLFNCKKFGNILQVARVLIFKNLSSMV